jgi:hypothetical protein
MEICVVLSGLPEREIPGLGMIVLSTLTNVHAICSVVLHRTALPTADFFEAGIVKFSKIPHDIFTPEPAVATSSDTVGLYNALITPASCCINMDV